MTEAATADLLQGDRVLSAGLQIALDAADPAAVRGTFVAPRDLVAARGEYTLRLADGRAGRIRIEATAAVSYQAVTAHFVALTPLA